MTEESIASQKSRLPMEVLFPKTPGRELRTVFLFPKTPGRKLRTVFLFPKTPGRELRTVFLFSKTPGRELRTVFLFPKTPGRKLLTEAHKNKLQKSHPSEQREIFELTELDGIPVKEISETTGVAVKGVC
jgi:hypothetical protein